MRYVGADDTAQPPLVKITVEPNSQAYIDVILHPDHEEPVLSRPGTCLIVRAMRPGMLAIAVEPSRNGRLDRGNRQHRAADPGRSRLT